MTSHALARHAQDCKQRATQPRLGLMPPSPGMRWIAEERCLALVACEYLTAIGADTKRANAWIASITGRTPAAVERKLRRMAR